MIGLKPKKRAVAQPARDAAAKPPPAPAPKSKRISPDAGSAEATYPLSEWQVPATDTHGHSAKVFTRCPPAYKHLIATILQSKLFPWDTESDLVRVALHRFLKQIEVKMKDPSVSTEMAILNSLTEIASQQMSNAHYSETLGKLKATVTYLVGSGDEPMARKVVKAIAEQIGHFEEPYWKDKYERELLKAHRDLLK